MAKVMLETKAKRHNESNNAYGSDPQDQVSTIGSFTI
ncbi:MAG: hypothetical protein ACI9WC_002695 [Arenicella sp.]|jgi:hypothetical protein